MPHQQGTAEWRLARIGKATASRFADIMASGRNGLEAATRRRYRAELVAERLTGAPASSGFDSYAMQVGREREPVARAEFEARTGLFVRESGFIEHPDLLAGASPDGLIGDDSGVEIKCPQPLTHCEYIDLPEGACPQEYVWQVQGCMWITERKSWFFVSFNPDFPENLRLVVRKVYRDEERIAELEKGVRDFLASVSREVARLSRKSESDLVLAG